MRARGRQGTSRSTPKAARVGVFFDLGSIIRASAYGLVCLAQRQPLCVRGHHPANVTARPWAAIVRAAPRVLLFWSASNLYFRAKLLT